MSPNPWPFLTHLQQEGYHSRSNKHSNALAEAIVSDLLKHCVALREKAAAGRVVYDLNFRLRAGTADWNVDLVLGAPALGEEMRSPEGPILRSPPSSVEIGVEIKSVMTEHRKAVKNRKRDLEAHHEHVHNYNPLAIAGGVLVINASARFRSPLRSETTTHRNPLNLVAHCIVELRSVAARGGPRGYGLEARCAIVVEMDNLDWGAATYLTRSPAPQIGDPLHYDAFIQTLCQRYTERFKG
jgi:hypothetical protein